MIKNSLKRLLLIICSLAIVFGCVSCGESETEEIGLYFMTDTEIGTLDPQLAKTKSELTCAYACFDRLLSYDKDGKIVKGRQVSDFSESTNGMTYSFTLADGFYWSDGKTPVTAEDYAYGIKRALSKETAAPYAGLLSALQPSGVQVAGNKITITLSSEDKGFKNVLAHPVCSPCNSEFFISTKGKYGLEDEKIQTNGVFYLYRWSTDDNYITIKKSSTAGADMSTVTFVRFDYNAKPEDIVAAAKEDTYNLYFADNDEFRDYTVGSKNVVDYFDTSYCLYTNGNLKVNDINIASVLKKDIDKDSFSINLPDYCRNSDSLFPSDLIYKNETAKVKLNVGKYDPSAALKECGNDEETYEFLSDLILYYPNFSTAKTYASMIAQTWQKDLNAYINIKPYDVSDIKTVLNNPDADEDTPVMAIVPIVSDDSTAKGATEKLAEMGIADAGDGSSDYQQKLVDGDCLYPLFEMSARHLYDNKVSGIKILPYGGILDFRFITKTE